MRVRRLRDSIVVITGAASGIGRASALRFARKGATLVLTANHEPALDALALECERLGARTLTLPAKDVPAARAALRRRSRRSRHRAQRATAQAGHLRARHRPEAPAPAHPGAARALPASTRTGHSWKPPRARRSRRRERCLALCGALRTGLLLGLLAVPVLLGWRWLAHGRGFFF